MTVLPRPPGASVTDVLDRIIQESDGAFVRTNDGERFAMPSGFETSAVIRTIRQYVGGADGSILPETWGSPEGVTTRLVVGVSSDTVVSAYFEARDWSAAQQWMPLFSEMELVRV